MARTKQPKNRGARVPEEGQDAEPAEEEQEPEVEHWSGYNQPHDSFARQFGDAMIFLTNLTQEAVTALLEKGLCDRDLVKDMNQGLLHKRRVKADAEYGHGRDVETLSFEQRATLRVWTDSILQRYFKE